MTSRNTSSSLNPVARRTEGYFAVLPVRFSLRGAHWWLGPFRSETKALEIAGLVRGARSAVGRAEGGWWVHVSGGLRLTGTPVIGPFRRSTEAGAVLARLLPARQMPELGIAPPVAARRRRVPSPAPTPPAVAEDDDAPKPLPPRRAQLPENVKNAIDALGRMGTPRGEAREMVLAAMEHLPPEADETSILRAVMGRASNPATGERVRCLACRQPMIVPPPPAVVECPHCAAILEVSDDDLGKGGPRTAGRPGAAGRR